MKNLFAILVLSFAFNQAVQAHGDHYEITEQDALTIAHKSIQKLSFKDLGFSVGKLPGSWAKVKTSDIKLLGNKGQYYLVSASQDQPKAIIYLKISSEGRVMEVSESLK